MQIRSRLPFSWIAVGIALLSAGLLIFAATLAVNSGPASFETAQQRFEGVTAQPSSSESLLRDAEIGWMERHYGLSSEQAEIAAEVAMKISGEAFRR